MSVKKNITMRQFNGTDYDTLYPKTDVKQIENLTPSSIGAVAKSGDTMTGNLGIANSNPYLELTETDSQEEYIVQVHQGDFYIGSQSHGSVNGLVLKPDGTILAKALYSVLHTGNAQTLGFPKIAIGSYVGTGTYGSSNPNSLTFDFEPKIVFLSADSTWDGLDTAGFMFFIRDQSGSPSWYYYNSNYYGRVITWSGNTLSWYTLTTNASFSPDRQQFNVNGQRYCYVALG